MNVTRAILEEELMMPGVERESNVTVTESDINEMNADLVGLYLEGKYDLPEMEMVTLEGANLDMRDAYRDAMKQSKAAMKEAKKQIKAKKYAEAKKSLNDASKGLTSAKKTIKDMDNTVLEVLIGELAREMHYLLKYLPLLLTSFLVIPAIVAIVKSTIDQIKGLITVVNDIIQAAKSKDGIQVKNLNTYRARLITAIEDAEKAIDTMKKNVSKLEKEAK